MMILLPCIIVLTVTGAFSIANTPFDIFVVIAFGLFGYMMRKLDFPIPPLVIGLVLGNLAETNLRRAMLLSSGNPLIFFTRPLSVLIIAVSMMLLFSPAIKNFVQKRKKDKGGV